MLLEQGQLVVDHRLQVLQQVQQVQLFLQLVQLRFLELLEQVQKRLKRVLKIVVLVKERLGVPWDQMEQLEWRHLLEFMRVQLDV
ncbi:hypothetical protein U1Q18_045890 [Sarracenia purpurea var. burkii]